jgi:hypothetical protein
MCHVRDIALLASFRLLLYEKYFLVDAMLDERSFGGFTGCFVTIASGPRHEAILSNFSGRLHLLS